MRIKPIVVILRCLKPMPLHFKPPVGRIAPVPIWNSWGCAGRFVRVGCGRWRSVCRFDSRIVFLSHLSKSNVGWSYSALEQSLLERCPCLSQWNTANVENCPLSELRTSLSVSPLSKEASNCFSCANVGQTYVCPRNCPRTRMYS